MSDNRRNFLKKTASLAAAAVSVGGIGSAVANPAKINARSKGLAYTNELAKDGGMKFALSLSLESPRIPFLKQMDVLHAVTGIKKNPDLKPWDPKAIIATKEAWDTLGIKWTVVEGPPTLGEQTKLGLAGRDEEIANFITFMKNLKQYGRVDTICYNWMPVVSWFRTKMDDPGRGGALMTSFDYEDAKKLPVTEFGQVSKETLWKTLE